MPIFESRKRVLKAIYTTRLSNRGFVVRVPSYSCIIYTRSYGLHARRVSSFNASSICILNEFVYSGVSHLPQDACKKRKLRPKFAQSFPRT